jgi:polyisoprenoid-binding protein YceI
MSATTWSIDPVHSQVDFAVKHMMFTTVRGRFSDVEGAIQLDAENPERSSVEVRIAAASIDTHVKDRDNHLRSEEFLDAEHHPELTFRSTKVNAESASPGDPFQVTGDLTIRGTTREVTLTGRIEGTGTDPWGGTRLGASAQTSIDRRDFGLTWNQALEAGGVLVGVEVKIELQVQAVQQQEAGVATDD